MSLISDTLSPFWAYPSLLLFLNTVCLAEKQQIPILYYLILPNRGSNPLNVSMLTMALPMGFTYFVVWVINLWWFPFTVHFIIPIVRFLGIRVWDMFWLVPLFWFFVIRVINLFILIPIFWFFGFWVLLKESNIINICIRCKIQFQTFQKMFPKKMTCLYTFN